MKPFSELENGHGGQGSATGGQEIAVNPDHQTPAPQVPLGASKGQARPARKARAQSQPAEPALLKPREVGRRLGISGRTVEALCRQGSMPHRKIGKRVIRFTQADVDEYLKLCRVSMGA